MQELLIWLGILLCITQAGIFSGLNLAFFSISRMRLMVEAERGSKPASRVLKLREDANFLLTSILWGNVAVNVLLTLLSNSVMAGASAFIFSTLLITFLGEIIPQAYFSRRALPIAAFFSPMIRFYQLLLYPLSKPTAVLLDAWLGREGITYLRERDLTAMIRAHIQAEEAEVAAVEGQGAINFLAIDDIFVANEGEPVDERSIIALPEKQGLPVIPHVERSPEDPFLQQLDASGHSWVILTNPDGKPLLVLDADHCLRDAVFDLQKPFNPYHYCHQPVLVTDPQETLGDLIWQLKKNAGQQQSADEAIAQDVILLWGREQKRIITGADLLGRLLKGIGGRAAK